MNMLSVNNMALHLLEEWVYDLANLQHLHKGEDVEQRAAKHVQRILDSLEDTYVIDVSMAKDQVDIEVKSFNDDAVKQLQEFADWANRFIESFNIRFSVFSWAGVTTYKDEYSKVNSE